MSLRRLSQRVSGAMSKKRTQPSDLSNDIVRYRGVSVQALLDLWQRLRTGDAAPGVDLVVIEDEHLKLDGVRLNGRTARVLGRERDVTVVHVPFVRGELELSDDQVKAKERRDWTIADVCEHVVLPEALAHGDCFFLDLLPAESVGSLYQGAFVSQARACSFGDLVAALAEHFAGADLGSQFVWLDVFSANQPKLTHGDSPDVRAQRSDLLTQSLHAAVERFDSRLIFFDSWLEPAPLKRMWCVWEVYGAARAGKSLELIFAPGQDDAFVAAAQENAHAIAMALARFEMRDAQCHSDSDRKMIARAVGALPGGFSELNGVVLQQLRGWLAKNCARVAHEQMNREGRSAQVGFVVGCLGFLLFGMGELDGADALWREGLAMTREALGDGSPHVAAFLHNLASVRRDRGDFAGALALFGQALAIYQTFPADEDVVSTVQGMGLAQQALGHYDLALHNLDQALRVTLDEFGPAHASSAHLLAQRAAVMQDKGDYDYAIARYREVLPLLREHLAKHPGVGEVLHSLGTALHATGELADAEAVLSEALAMRREQLGPRHAQTVACMCALSLLHTDMSRFSAAREGAEEAKLLLREAGRDANTDLTTSLAFLALGRALSGLKVSDEASAALWHALTVREGVLGAEHPDCAVALHALAQHTRDRAQARRALEIREKRLGKGHPLTNESRALLFSLPSKKFV